MLPGERITIDGQACVVIRDAMANYMPDEKNDVVVLGCHGRFFFYASGEELRQAGKRAPGARTVGLWHVLFSSNALDEEGVYVLYFDADKNGQYAFRDNKTTFIGEVRGGKPVVNFGHLINLAHAKEVRPENIKLRLPDESMTAAKRSKHRRELYNKALSLAGIVLVLGVSAGAWMYEHKIANAHEMGNRQASEALVNVEHVKSQLKSAQQERIGAWPRQAEAMQGFLFMAAHNLRFSVKGTKVNAEKMVATLHADDAHRAHIVTEESGVEHEHLIDGSVLLSWYVPKGVQ